jgi:hypothetical protein
MRTVDSRSGLYVQLLAEGARDHIRTKSSPRASGMTSPVTPTRSRAIAITACEAQR